MIIEERVLYMRDNTGAMRQWSISAIDGDITISHGQMGGSLQHKTEVVIEGKASRSLREQVQSRIDSRISKQMDKGYIRNLAIAQTSKATNTLGLPKPMLAHKLKDVKNIDFNNAVSQPKFDGNRCMIYCKDGINYAYSRNGKPMEAIDHILDDIVLTEGQIIDGELYCHGESLQTIVSWVKRKQLNSLKLKYHLYDIIMDASYPVRSDCIMNLPHGDSVIPVPGDPCPDLRELMAKFREYRELGYEGAILRWGEAGYEDGKRSKFLVKVKEWESDEFFVIDIIPSKDGWARLVCDDKHGGSFTVSAPGSMLNKKEILQNKDNYIGRDITVEYANLTKDRIPFHPVAINFRDEIQ